MISGSHSETDPATRRSGKYSALRSPESAPVSPDVVKALTVPLFFDYLGVRLNGPKAEGQRIVINWVFTDIGERYVLNLENAALTYLADKQDANADLTVTLERPFLSQILMDQISLDDAKAKGLVNIDGDGEKLAALFALMDEFRLMFPVIEPRSD